MWSHLSSYDSSTKYLKTHKIMERSNKFWR